MNVVVSGGTGFLGRPLVNRLLKEGHAVTVLARSVESAKRSLAGLPAEFFDAEGPADSLSLEGQDAVVNLAGESIAKRWTDEHKARVTRSRVDGTRSLVKAAVKAKTVKVLISGSAIGYYGARGSEELSEGSAPGDDFLAKLCVAWEAATSPAREAKIRTVVARTGVVLHPDGGALSRMLPPFRLGIGGRLGTGSQIMSWIHRSDWVELCLHCLRSPEVAGPVNFTAPHPVTNREFTRMLGRSLHRPTSLPVPAFALKVALGEMSTMLLDGQCVLPKRALASGFQFQFPTLEDALADLFARKAA